MTAGLGFTTKVSNPGTLPAGTGQEIAFSPDGAYVAIAHATSPFLSVYPWSSAGLGTKVANPGTLPAGLCNGVAWSPDGAYIAVAHNTSPFISIYPWSGGAFGTKVTNPATLPGGAAVAVAWSPDSAYVGVASTGSPFLDVYPFSGGAFGTRVTNPATMPNDWCFGIAWSPDGAYLAVACTSSTAGLSTLVYPWSAGFGTKITSPSGGNAVSGTSNVAWTANGSHIAFVTQSGAPYLHVYPWSGAFGTKISEPASQSSTNDIQWSADGTYVAIARTATPYVLVYAWTGSAFGAKAADPGTIPTGRGDGVAFSPTLAVAVAHTTSPFITAYAETVVALAGVATGTGAAYGTSASLEAHPPTATSAGTAFGPTVDTGPHVSANAGIASGTGAAGTPHASIKPNGTGTSSGTGRAFNASAQFTSAPTDGYQAPGGPAELTDWRIKILGYDFTRKCEWVVNIEETLNSPASANFILQDRVGGDPLPFSDVNGGVGFDFDRADVEIYLLGQPEPLFRGRVMNYKGDLPVGMPWPRYAFSCSDYQEEVFARRLVGVPNGNIWSGPDSDGNYTAVDNPHDGLAGTDRAKLNQLVTSLVYIAGNIPTTDDFVGTYLPDLTTIAPGVLFDRTDIRGVAEQMAGLYEFNIQYWMDNLFRIHWVVMPRWFDDEPYDSLLVDAPADIDNDTPNGSSSIGSRGLDWTFDFGQGLGSDGEYFISGGLGYEYNGGLVKYYGSGWEATGVATDTPPDRDRTKSQALLTDLGAVDAEGRAAAGRRARNQIKRGVLRGMLTVGNDRHHPDGWHPGQLMRVSDVRLPANLNGRRFPIQRVSMKLVPTINWRIYDLEWGDAPTGRTSTKPKPAKREQIDLPGRVWDIATRKLSPLPGSTETIVGQLVAEDGTPRRIPNVTICLELLAWDENDDLIVGGAGALSTDTVTTDSMGRWQVDVTFDATPGYSYQVNPIDCV